MTSSARRATSPSDTVLYFETSNLSTIGVEALVQSPLARRARTRRRTRRSASRPPSAFGERRVLRIEHVAAVVAHAVARRQQTGEQRRVRRQRQRHAARSPARRAPLPARADRDSASTQCGRRTRRAGPSGWCPASGRSRSAHQGGRRPMSQGGAGRRVGRDGSARHSGHEGYAHDRAGDTFSTRRRATTLGPSRAHFHGRCHWRTTLALPARRGPA